MTCVVCGQKGNVAGPCPGHLPQRGGSFSREPPVSASVEWYTPARVFEALGAVFDLDVASPGADVVPWIPARGHLTPEEDGLTSPWVPNGGGGWEPAFVWMNPPYGAGRKPPGGGPRGPGLGAWVERFCEHRNGVALLFARTENSWFRRFEKAGATALFIHGRVSFVAPGGDVPGYSGAGSVLFALGERGEAALINAERAGLGTRWRALTAPAAQTP